MTSLLTLVVHVHVYLRMIHLVEIMLALIHTFNDIYEENGDSEVYGLAKLLRKYKFVA